jgi:hypothetical protein
MFSITGPKLYTIHDICLFNISTFLSFVSSEDHIYIVLLLSAIFKPHHFNNPKLTMKLHYDYRNSAQNLLQQAQ